MSQFRSILSKKITRQDIWVGILCIPFYINLIYLLYGSRYFQDQGVFLPATLIALFTWFFSWRTHITVGYYVREVMQDVQQTSLRLVISCGIYVILTGSITCILTYLLHLTGYLGFRFELDSFLIALLSGLVVNVVATSVFEGFYIFANWRDALLEAENFKLEAEKLKKANLQSQLDGLKSQVNPHFLFNSLNSLSALISSNPQKAEEFLDEMSKVYRYLLRTNEQELTTLAAEIKFAFSYFHMLKTRYGDGIAMEIQTGKAYDDYLLPPLTLQMLLENAVKHNVILKEVPLMISIRIDDDENLVVSNTLHKKRLMVQSNKIGLANIATKYHLLNQPDIRITETDTEFAVTIPLIKSWEKELSVAD
jgi:sensor histidine kinase YesM